jgi:hypothetical protein
MRDILKKYIIKWLKLILTISVLSFGFIYAQEGDAGTQSVLNFGPGARAMGLGRAYAAVADDPTAVFWNPSGLEFVPRMSFTLFHTSLYEGTNYDFIGFVYPTLRFGTVGIGFARLGIGDIPVVDRFNVRQGSSSFETSEIYISYAKALPWNLTTGLTFKIDRQQFEFENLVTGGIGLDLGLMYRPQTESGLLNNFSFGFQFQNLIKPELKLGPQTETLPALYRLCQKPV